MPRPRLVLAVALTLAVSGCSAAGQQSQQPLPPGSTAQTAACGSDPTACDGSAPAYGATGAQGASDPGSSADQGGAADSSASSSDPSASQDSSQTTSASQDSSQTSGGADAQSQDPSTSDRGSRYFGPNAGGGTGADCSTSGTC